jgi:uncharacterized RDD family membrane protein YckC
MGDGESWYVTLGGRRIELAEGELVVGRGRDCDLRVRDGSVSRAHALVSVTPGRVTVQDLGSSNGTRVNGSPAREETEVLVGDQIRLGRVRLTLGRGPAGEGPLAGTDTGYVCSRCGAPLVPGAGCERCGAPPGGHRPLSRSEAVSVSDVLPVGEALARPARSLDDTRPSFPLAWTDEDDAADPWADPGTAAERVAPPAAGPPQPEAPWTPPADEADLPATRPESGRYLPAAGFWPRAAAFLLDAAWTGGLGALVAVAAGGWASRGGVSAGVAVALLVSALVAVVGWSRRGDSPGKRLFHLCVCDLDGHPGIGAGRALLRWAAYAASALPLGAGFLAAGLTASRRGFHDRLAGTYVARRDR